VVQVFDAYLEQIESALDAGLFYPALALALALPDICMSCELPPDKGTTRTTYERWCRTYFGNSLDPHEVYTLRCAFLHNGTTEFAKRHHARGRTAGINLHWHGANPSGMLQVERKSAATNSTADA
jgi:hypothetical protein